MEKLHIESIRILALESGECTPTAVLYRKNVDPVIGRTALETETFDERANKHFKIVLGEQSKAKIAGREKLSTGSGEDKSAFEITSTFLRTLLRQTRMWPEIPLNKKANAILVAEPLQFFLDADSSRAQNDEWLKNYRDHVRNILTSHFHRVEFLPEPFAAYIYFREGKRHPAVVGRREYSVLVVDAGGGTFDASVITTTKRGDVAIGGEKSKPLSAASKAIGGEDLDKLIAQECMMQALQSQGEKKELRSTFNAAEKHDASVVLGEKKHSALCWLSLTTRKAEIAKISLSRQIADWALEDIPNVSVPIEVPVAPFVRDSPTTTVSFSAQALYNILLARVWDKGGVRATVRAALQRAKSKLGAKRIDLVLMSGGTANIGWVAELVKIDFNDELGSAAFVKMEGDFQHIVSLGLAAENARRNLLRVGDAPESSRNALAEPSAVESPSVSGDSAQAPVKPDPVSSSSRSDAMERRPRDDFNGVLYNNIYVLLSADEDELMELPLRPIDALTKSAVEPDAIKAELLPAGVSMQEVVDKTLAWKVRLPRSPRHRVNYKFLRMLGDEVSLMDEYNVEQTAFCRGESKEIAGQIWLELTVRNKGTVFPRFVFKRDKLGEATRFIEAAPFPLDATDVSFHSEAVNQRRDPMDPSYAEFEEGDNAANDLSISSPRDVDMGAADYVEATNSSQLEGVYFGLDFGSSNSSIAYVSKRSVQVVDSHSDDANWNDLSQCLDRLPALISRVAKEFLALEDSRDESAVAAQLLEASLCYLAYVAYSQVPIEGKKSKLFKGFEQRSAGPLKKLWVSSMQTVGDGIGINPALEQIWERHREAIDGAITELNEVKHHQKEAMSRESLAMCSVLALEVARLGDSWKFGFFQSADEDPFSGETRGVFRIAHGLAPFHEKIAYEAAGVRVPKRSVPCLLDINNGSVLVLAPLLIWEVDKLDEDLLIYDSYREGKGGKSAHYKFKSAFSLCSRKYSVDQGDSIVRPLDKLRTEDVPVMGTGAFTVSLKNDNS